MKTPDNEPRKAKVKGTNREVEVYKIKNTDEWNIFLGDKLTMAAVQENKHRETFTTDQLEFIK